MTTPKPPPLRIAPLDLDGAHRRFKQLLGIKPPPVCAACSGQSHNTDVQPESARTAYPYTDKTKPDPNAPIHLCRPCAKKHHEEMDDLWQEYRSGQM